MGLFSNNKKLCPICGGATPRLLATKVEGEAICSDCAYKLDIRDDVRNNLTLNQLKQYMSFYEENQPLKNEFKADYERKTGFLKSDIFLCDYTHRTFKLNKGENAIVYTPESFSRLVVSEGETPVIVLTPEELRVYKSNVPGYIMNLKEDIDAFNAKMGMRDAMQDISREMRKADERREAKDQGKFFNEYEFDRAERQREREDNINRPSYNPDMPFNKWKIEIEVNHAWGGGFSDTDNQSWFGGEYPSVNEGLDNYFNSLALYKELAMAFRKVCCPNCKVVDESGAPGASDTEYQRVGQANTAAPAAGVDAAAEIKKYKELLDQGILTQEEFDAKKKQLLGI